MNSIKFAQYGKLAFGAVLLAIVLAALSCMRLREPNPEEVLGKTKAEVLEKFGRPSSEEKYDFVILEANRWTQAEADEWLKTPVEGLVYGDTVVQFNLHGKVVSVKKKASSPAPAESKADPAALVAMLTNSDVKWDGNTLGLSPSIEGKPARQLLGLGRKASPVLRKALSDPGKFAAAHVLLTRIETTEYKVSASHWNKLKVDLNADGTVNLHPEQIDNIKTMWNGEPPRRPPAEEPKNAGSEKQITTIAPAPATKKPPIVSANESNTKNLNALADAVNRKDLAALKKVLQAGANPNIVMMDGTTVLHAAAGMGQRQCVALLLEHGADPGIADNRGRTALYMAVISEDSETLEELIKAGANPAVKDRAGKTPLDRARENYAQSPETSPSREKAQRCVEVLEAASTGKKAETTRNLPATRETLPGLKP